MDDPVHEIDVRGQTCPGYLLSPTTCVCGARPTATPWNRCTPKAGRGASSCVVAIAP